MLELILKFIVGVIFVEPLDYLSFHVYDVSSYAVIMELSLAVEKMQFGAQVSKTVREKNLILGSDSKGCWCLIIVNWIV